MCPRTCVNWCSSSLNRGKVPNWNRNPNKAAGNWPWAAVLSQIALQHLKAGIFRLACSTWPHSGNHRTQPGLYVSVIRCIPVSKPLAFTWLKTGSTACGVVKGRLGSLMMFLAPSLQRSSNLDRERRHSRESRQSSADFSKLILNPHLSFGCQYKIRIPIWIFLPF